jgi:acetaldehyde dehydrogenase (acetylating)
VLSLIFVADYATALDTCFGLLKFGGAGHTAAIYAKNDTRIREYGMRMPAMRVLVNTPAPQGSTGITTNVFPSMTLGCGAMAGNSTSDNVGPLHLINIKRLAYTVRTPEEAFEMPLDYDKAQDGPMPAMPAGGGAIDRATVVSAVERYLASRGIGVAAPAAPAIPAPPAAHSCGCSTPAPAPVQQSVVANVAAEVVDRFLALRGSAQGGSQKSGGYS